jgi:hypothetical protein
MDNGAEEATAVPIPEPINPDPGVEDVELQIRGVGRGRLVQGGG